MLNNVAKLLEVKEEERGEIKDPAGRTHNPLDEIMVDHHQATAHTRAKRMAKEEPLMVGLAKDQTVAIQQQGITKGTAI